jgi:hypothetical protein
VPFLLNHVIGVSNAPPRLSSDPREETAGAEAGVLHDIEVGARADVPFDRTLRDEGSGIAGGRGKMLAPDVTCTTRSKAWR